MELSGRPLLDNASDARLYTPRAIDDDLERNALAGVNTLVVSERGMGKTTTLRQLTRRLRARPDIVAVFVDGNLPTPGPIDLVQTIMRAGARASGFSSLRLAVLGDLTTVEGRDNDRLVEAVRRLRRVVPEGTKRIVAIVDSLSEPVAAHTVFGRLRDELWQSPYRFIASVDSSMARQVLRPPADAFFEEVLQLGALTSDEQMDIARRRVGKRLADRLRPRLEVLDAETPRRLIRLLRHLVEDGEDQATSYMSSIENRNRSVSRLGRPSAMLVAELEALGPRSASDDELLRRLGWTRQRAAQVFRQLEDAGLVKGDRLPGPQGRPRRVFSLVEPEAVTGP